MPRNSKNNSLARYKLMVDLCEKYNDYITYPRARIIMRSETKAKIKSAIHFVRTFKQALSHLEDKYVEIIKHEFLSDEHNYWWRLKYSRATFYRNRDKAVISFLEQFRP